MVIETKVAACLAVLAPLLAALVPMRGYSFLAAATTVFFSGLFLAWQAIPEPVIALNLYTWLAGDTLQWTLAIAVEAQRITLLSLFNSVALLLAIYALGFRREVESRDFTIAALVLLSMQVSALAASDLSFLLAWSLLAFAALWGGAESDGWNGVRPLDRLGDALLVIGMVLLLVNFSRAGILCILVAAWTRMGHLPFPLEIFRSDTGRCKGWVFALMGDLASPFLAFVLLLRYRAAFVDAGVLDIVLYAGLGTSFLAGLAALKASDLRRSLSMTTAGQTGLVLAFMAMGAEAAAFFLLAVHGIAKALARVAVDGLALAAGGKWSRRELGLLRRQLPLFSATFSLASLLLALGPGMACLWMWNGQESEWVLGVWSVAAFLYALQKMAVVVRVFSLPPSEQPHAFPAPQQASGAALVGLAALALVVAVALPHSPLNWMRGLGVGRGGSLTPLAFAPLGAGALGLLLAWLLFRGVEKEKSASSIDTWERWLAEGYYLRDLYAVGVARPLLAWAGWLRDLSAALVGIALTEGVALTLRGIGRAFALVHNGRVRGYGVALLVGVIALLWGMANG
ncbi:MAG: proton-conducting transporter transmembrane domain-containing protein [Candidatus Latescibacterota bacterium]|jgi:NADH:ubiquinone oxidoreductase subunit 5 (subunit L)/multisubunit Na+/H+ antiporter MnhA subunit